MEPNGHLASTTTLSCKFIKRGKPQPHKLQVNSSDLYPFCPVKPVMIYPITRFTPFDDRVVSLMQQVQETKIFSIYTRRHPQTHQVKLIAIEFIQEKPMPSIVLIFDFFYKPDETTLLFAMIEFLLVHIFKPEKHCFVWDGEQKQDLDAFVEHHYLSRTILESMKFIPLQQLFKEWYNRTFPHNRDCFVSTNYIHDSIYCICPHRPYRDMYDKWHPLKALFYVFHEYVHTINEQYVRIPRDIQYSVTCCMIMTKLSMAIGLNWTSDQLHEFNSLRHRQLE